MGVKISDLTAASTLDGTEELECVQSGNSRRATAQDIADLAAQPAPATLLTSLDRAGYAHAGDFGSGGGLQAVGITVGNAPSGGGSGPNAPDGSTALLSLVTQTVEVTASSANLTVGFVFSNIKAFRTTTAGYGGFIFKARFGVDSSHGAERYAIGVASAQLGQTSDPSSLTDMFMFAKDVADTNISIMSNDASGTATKTAIGPTLASLVGKLLDLTLSCDENGALSWSLTVVDDGTTYSGDISTNVPAANTLLQAFFLVNSGSGSATDTRVRLSKVFFSANTDT